MPIYEFVCQECGHEFELIQSFSDNTVPGCPVCQETHVIRQVGRPAIHFKGSGWYINDSKKAAKTSANGKNNGDSEKSTGEQSDDADSGSKASEGKASEGKASDGKASDSSASKDKTESSKKPSSSTTKTE